LKTRAKDRDGLYQRGERWYFKFKKQDGTWGERATGLTSYNEARKSRAQFMAEIATVGLPGDRAKWTLKVAVDEHLAERKLRIKPGSYKSEACIANKLVDILGADKRLEDIADISVIRRYESKRLSDEMRPKTVNNEVLVLAGILRSARLWKRLVDDYKPLKVDKTDARDALTDEESKRLIEAARTAEENAVAPYAAILSFSSGMRNKEIKQLQLGSIHLDGRDPHVQVRRITTKTNAGARFVALDSMACWALRKLIDRATRLGSTAANHYLLPTLRERHTSKTDPLNGGTGFDPHHPMSSWDAEWDSLRKSANLERHDFHSLRHSYITRAALASVPLATIQAQVGHMSAQVTAMYLHISQRAVHKAAKQIEEQSTELMAHLGLAPAEPKVTAVQR
jgi:integrase